jgi:hypothetical protein
MSYFGVLLTGVSLEGGRRTPDDPDRARPASGPEKADKKLITQKQAAEEIGVTEQQVRRLLRNLRSKGGPGGHS